MQNDSVHTFLHAKLCVHKKNGGGCKFTLFNLQFANCHHFSYIFHYQLTLKNISRGYAQNRMKMSMPEGSIRHTFLFCRHVFTFFRKCQLLSISLTFCFISKINYKNENWYHCRFHLPGFY